MTIRPPTIHVILMDGTFASLMQGRRSSIGRIRDLLTPAQGAGLRLYYGMGQQWARWQTLPDLALGRMIEARIIDAYGWLAGAYRPGDAVFLLGYSRGAFAARSLAGMIGRVGLVRPEYATERYVRLAWRYYRQGAGPGVIATFHRRRCHAASPIRMVGCFDTVTAFGLRLPLLWMLTEPRFRFHDAHLGDGVEHGFHALALDETRAAFAPLLWDDAGDMRVEQVWFRGAHGDIGGQLGGYEPARPLANIPLVWMLDRAETLGLPLPDNWRAHMTTDPTSPSVGSWRNWGKAFLVRAPRLAGQYDNESLHETVPRPYPGPALLTGHLTDDAATPIRRRA
ncbi:DUF2235 domain-containing protein [Paracoccus sp. (in: a-proteobacteria)]|uniref:DUF2235 domain-containing protein n=1 Tax=Paracoccus sp. TaxID=267 RepID=UPI0026E094A2|nr:DUF2235 domain-containing protein [Paracoccus sp. (in: a-proteobacteria)]MDO5648079.1 DUF2235 domain-containing protein [Paracoccus sp. (in: a-proteobacteria)]